MSSQTGGVVAPDAHSEVDVLVQDGRRELVSPTVRRVVLCLLAVVLLTGWLVDHRIRGHESAGVDSCAARTAAALDAAHGRVAFMSGYVRPALAGAPTDHLRTSLYAMVSDAAAGSAQRLRTVLDACRRTSVLRLHGDLRDRRADCATSIRRALGYLEAVSVDGRAAFRPSAPRARPVVGCTR